MHKYRTHNCDELNKTDIDTKVKVAGWLHSRRDHGGILFLDIRDNYGITQVVVNPEMPFYHEIAHMPKESVLSFTGIVRNRPEENINPNLKTGGLEVIVESYELLGSCDPLPFPVFPEDAAPEDLRLAYRFLDLRRSKIHKNIKLRSQVISYIRTSLIDEGFNEFQTPILTSSSPEGARDFLVPSRLHPGQFFALPQAPQQFKQLIMVSGFDKYFQIAPCFRDEDARADRSPGEFYQLDLEMSFVTQEDIFRTVENLFINLFREFTSWEVVSPFPRIPFAEAMLKYGTDKPDLRIPLKIRDISPLFTDSSFRAFAGKTVRVLPVANCSGNSRSFFDRLEDYAKSLGAKGLAWLIVDEDEKLKGPIAKFINDEQRQAMLEQCDAKPGHCLFFSADSDVGFVCQILGKIRTYIAEKLDLIEKEIYKFCWITDFPMYELEDGKVAFSHNPFSMPQGGLQDLLEKDPLDIKAWQYDIVCNGYELSSGAIRNHSPEIMYKAFEIAGYTQEEVDEKFRAMIKAFKYGAPPHGGIAPGIDRIVMLIADEPNIREVITFPMNQRAQDLMMNAPQEVSEAQLKDVHIRVSQPAPKL